VTTDDRGPVLRRAPAERERLAEVIADRLDGPMTALGIVFVLMVIAETVIEPKGALSTAFTVGGWVLWATFVAELYAVALHDAAYATVTGEPLSADTGLARVMELVLATYSVVVSRRWRACSAPTSCSPEERTRTTARWTLEPDGAQV